MTKFVFAFIIAISTSNVFSQESNYLEIKNLHLKLVDLVRENYDLKAQLDSVKLEYEKQTSGFYVRLSVEKFTVKPFKIFLSQKEERGMNVCSLSSFKNKLEALEMSKLFKRLNFYDFKVIYKGSFFDTEYIKKIRLGNSTMVIED